MAVSLAPTTVAGVLLHFGSRSKTRPIPVLLERVKKG